MNESVVRMGTSELRREIELSDGLCTVSKSWR
jgi:hypothetical protein